MSTASCPWPARRPTAWPGPGRIHVWCVDRRLAGAACDQVLEFLSADEVERAGRLMLEPDRRRFAVGCGILRDLLGAYLETSPAEVRLRLAGGGKPALSETDASPPLLFNTAHTEHLSLFAFATDHELGVDIETVADHPQMDAVVGAEFAPEEAAAIRSVDAAQRPLAFALAWTRKEAVLKAIGDGLARPLDSFAVTCAPDQPARVLRAPPDQGPADQGPAEAWSLHSLQPAPGCVAAIAQRREATLDCFRWRPRSC